MFCRAEDLGQVLKSTEYTDNEWSRKLDPDEATTFHEAMEGVEATTNAARSCNNVAGNLGWNSTNQEDACAANERTWKVNILELKIVLIPLYARGH